MFNFKQKNFPAELLRQAGNESLIDPSQPAGIATASIQPGKPAVETLTFEFVETLSNRDLMLASLVQVFENLKSSPLVNLITLSILTLLVFVLSLSLKSYLLVTDKVSSLENSAPVRIYLNDNIGKEQLAALQSNLAREEFVSSVKVKSKQQALADFKIRLNEVASLLNGLEEMNPLPASIEIYFREGQKNGLNYEQFTKKYSKAPGVDNIRYDKFLVSFISQAFNKLDYIALPVLILIVTAIFFITWAAFYLLISRKRAEIEVLRLLGATRSYIKSPYLIICGLLGTVSAVLGICLTEFIFSAFNNFQIYSATVMQSVAAADASTAGSLALSSWHGRFFYAALYCTLLALCLLSANSCLNKYLKKL